MEIEPNLQKASPENGSFLRNGWRISRLLAREIRRPGNWRTDPSSKSRHWRAFRDRNGNILQNAHWLAGAGGFEPPHGGIKIPCLTTWRRPNSVEQFTARRALKTARRNCSISNETRRTVRRFIVARQVYKGKSHTSTDQKPVCMPAARRVISVGCMTATGLRKPHFHVIKAGIKGWE